MENPFEGLLVGERYDRKQIAPLLGYSDWQALGRGAVTPRGRNYIVLLITGKNQPSLPDYKNYFVGDELHLSGEKSGRSDSRLANAESSGDAIYLFFRDSDHQHFTYYGEAIVTGMKRTPHQPTRFVLQTQRSEAIGLSALRTEIDTHQQEGADLSGKLEGNLFIRQHRIYERATQNRAAAIRIHGTKCKVCGFDFDDFYGSELAREYIEIHHTQSITAGARVPDPATDLIPLCSNCHSMVHRERGKILPVAALRARIMKRHAPNGEF